MPEALKTVLSYLVVPATRQICLSSRCFLRSTLSAILFMATSHAMVTPIEYEEYEYGS